MGNVFLYIFCLYCTITLFPYDLRPCDAHALISRYLDGLMARVLQGVQGEAAQPKEATITLIPYDLRPCDAHALISRYLDGLLARVLWGVKGEAAQPKEATIRLIPYNLHPCDVRWNRGSI